MVVVASSVKEQIICAAERLFAERGVVGVSLRQIGVAAGNGNNSAVQYHFGSKDKLIQSIFEYRLARLHARRAVVIEELQPTDVRGWVSCQARAVLEQSELDGSHYMRFVAMLYQYGHRDVFVRMPAEFVDATREFHAALASVLPHIVEPLRSHRIARAMALIVYVAADRERQRASGFPVLPLALELGELADGMVGFLNAEASQESLRALVRAEPSVVDQPMLL
ncbi:TetR/AcrR family transcriptional regulator [Mycobacterium sp. RTGN5]|uniref:TetR/AcrR family transcriptional regulator n=1 Tax=Mycobacterium sp. RTGN5 TaxID=3016522 RepID=UPI0029C895CF|nr:TetR/AcrR family transcriptional regulator [Mycobacterium sp. RTGN5]